MEVVGVAGSTVSLSIDPTLTRATAFSSQIEGVSGAPLLARFTPSQLLRIEEQLAETELSLSAPVGARLGTRDNVTPDSSTHVLTLTLRDGTDGFPSAIVTSFSLTVTSVGGFDISPLQFSLWDGENDVLAQGSHLGAGSVAFQGVILDAADGRIERYQIRVFRSGSLPGVSDGMSLEFQLDGEVGLTDSVEGDERSIFSGVAMNAVASFNLDVQAVDVVVAGPDEWDLVDPYALIVSGVDGDGNIDDDFGIDSVSVFARLDGEPTSTTPVVLVESRVPPSVYRADTDGRALIFTAQGVGRVSNEHRVVVDVTATRLVAVGAADVSPSGTEVLVSQSVMAVLGDADCNVAMSFPCVRDTNYSGVATAAYNPALSVGVTTPVVSFDQAMIENGMGVIAIAVNSTTTLIQEVPQIALWLAATGRGGQQLLPFLLTIPYQPVFDLDIDGNTVITQLVDYAIMFAWAFNIETYRVGTLLAGGDPTDPMNINLLVAAQALGSPIAQGWLDSSIPTGEERSLEEAVQKLVRLLPPIPPNERVGHPRYEAIDIDGNGVTTQLVDYAIMFAWAFNRDTYRVGTLLAGGDPTDTSNINLSFAAQALGSPIAQGWISIDDGTLFSATQKLLRIFPP